MNMIVNYKEIPEAERIMYSDRIIIVVDENLNAYTNEEIRKIEGDIKGVVFCG